MNRNSIGNQSDMNRNSIGNQYEFNRKSMSTKLHTHPMLRNSILCRIDHTWLRLKSTSNNYPTRKPLTLRLNYHKKVLGHLWEGLSKNVSVKNLFGCLLIDQNVSKK